MIDRLGAEVYRPPMATLGLSFVLLDHAVYPEPEAVIAAAAELGLELRYTGREGEGPDGYEVAGGATLLVMLVDAPHPDAATLPPGLASPSPEEVEAHAAHLIITTMSLPDAPRDADTLQVKLTAAVVGASPAIAAMLGHGVVLHRAGFFTDIAAGPISVLPLLVCVDVTIAAEADERMSFLTHGLQRYGREEFFVTASRTGQGAVDFLLALVGWMLDDPDKQLPTGDTVGRTADEQVRIQRVANPTGEGPEVIRLDLDLGEPA